MLRAEKTCNSNIVVTSINTNHSNFKVQVLLISLIFIEQRVQLISSVILQVSMVLVPCQARGTMPCSSVLGKSET